MRFSLRRRPIIVKQDDLFKQKVDVIVNPANSHMQHGGGLAYQFAQRGGPRLVEASTALAPVPTGQAIITFAGNLQEQGFKAVIHAVGPIWDRGKPDKCDRLLYAAHRSALWELRDNGYQTIGFPAVSCGIFGYPVDRAAPIAIKAARDAVDQGLARRVVFCLFESDHYQAYKEALDA